MAPPTPPTTDISMTDVQTTPPEGREGSDPLRPTDSAPAAPLDPTASAASLSTTDSIPSETYRQMADPTHKPEECSTSATDMPTSYLPTVTAYDAWAPIYDTDGNVLQKVDDLELERMLSAFLEDVVKSREGNGGLRVLDLGCGTARNTVKLMVWGWPEGVEVEIVGVDASRGMLDIARRKMDDAVRGMGVRGRKNIPSFSLQQHDFLDPKNSNSAPVMPPAAAGEGPFDAILTTLVLEHFPLSTFLTILDKMIRHGGMVLLTNMHPDMGARSQAGFVSVDGEGRQVKVRGRSWVHGVEETADCARAMGFEVMGSVGERAVTEGILEGLGDRARKWLGTRVWYGMVLRKKMLGCLGI